MLLWPQPWAEDGPIFIQQQIYLGWRAIFVPYAGYYHLIPRIVTMLAVQMSVLAGRKLELVPFIMNVTAISLGSFSVCTICRQRFEWLAPLWARAALAVLIVSLPASYEVFGNITNIQWWLGLYQFFFMWDIFANRRLPPWPDSAMLMVASVSGPLGVLPLAGAAYVLVAAAVERRSVSWLELAKTAMLVPGPTIEMVSAIASRITALGDPTRFHGNVLESVVRVLFGTIIAQVFIPHYPVIVNLLGYPPLIFTGVGFLICIGLITAPRWRLLAAPTIAVAILLGAEFLGGRYWAGQYSYPFSNDSGRYLFVPMAIVLCVFVSGSAHWCRRGLRFAILPFLLGILIVFNDSQVFSQEPVPNYHWNLASNVFRPNGKASCGIVTTGPATFPTMLPQGDPAIPLGTRTPMLPPGGWVTMVPCYTAELNPVIIGGHSSEFLTPVLLVPGSGVLTKAFKARFPVIAVAPFLAVAPLPQSWLVSYPKAVKLTLRQGAGRDGIILRQTYVLVSDNGWPILQLVKPIPPGTYTLEISQPIGAMIWWWADRVDLHDRPYRPTSDREVITSPIMLYYAATWP